MSTLESTQRSRTIDRDATFYVAGHKGLVGSAVWRHLDSHGFTNLIGETSTDLDLRDRTAVFDYIEQNKPTNLVLAAAKVGGILANSTYPVDFISSNLQVQVNLLDAALQFGVERVLFLGSSCIYPKHAAQPIKEEYLLTGPLEPTNDAYAIAKIAGILQIQSVRKQYGLPWISAMPTNLYGPGDNFSPQSSHVLPALIRRYDEAAKAGTAAVTNWGSGSPKREFLHVDDMASACLHLLDHYDGPSQVNVGTGEDQTIKEVAEMVADEVGYSGRIDWDTSKPDGTPRKLLDVSTLKKSGWKPAISLREGIASTVRWYRENVDRIRQ
ncbi:GDP-fucose synthetase [Rhodococcus sp. 05-2255-3B1]|uniref:GDP-L-fucose synthase family protein n=1 Tax=unclassified Rhodococcus (in: high G+C Gram-positive bacteria) TaxID=192944 RepID=UPI000B9B5F10|nr:MULTISPECIES: GDP-L-fucose synthase [unclassified Rhodococcus (in: high G+C Gram-positive bacteria)]OZE02530.1 GDP-fucose synthetase [Rhodococcus sp. 05-2255-3C]OZE11404.1 GDP-fucose synthetase [Rhodococcus sp. 05-2255-3B1]OZE13130.1 GDP-fucose synthetase [Rhodococcus sp. 05-2255-2A2]